MTNEEHNKYIAWAFLANGVFQILMLGFVFFIMFAVILGGPDGRDFPAGLFATIFGFVAVINLVMLSPNFVAAYALLKRKPWARIAGIIAAALSAMNVPLGTLAAVYSLWFFCGDQWKSLYAESDTSAPKPLHSGPVADTNWQGYSTEEEGAYIYRTPPPPDWR